MTPYAGQQGENDSDRTAPNLMGMCKVIRLFQLELLQFLAIFLFHITIILSMCAVRLMRISLDQPTSSIIWNSIDMKMAVRAIGPGPIEHVTPAIPREDLSVFAHFGMLLSARPVLSAAGVVGGMEQCIG